MNEKTRFMLALIAPAALVLLCFQVVPILTGANASFRDWTLYDPKKTWVGLANYIHVLRDAEFLLIVLPNTFGFMVATVALSLVLGLMIALVLNKRFPGRWLVQSFVLLPLMVAPVIAAIMIRWMFNDQFGVVNAVIEGLGFAPISWLTQRWTAFFVILLTDIWLWTPWFALILLAGLQSLPPEPFEAAAIDGALSDTAAFCEAYGESLSESANCVVVAGKREGVTRYAACLVLAIDRADVNGVVRRLLDVRKASFLPMDDAVALTAMEYGGITALGLPAGWRIFVDGAVADGPRLVVGSGIRGSKLCLSGAALLDLPKAERIDGLAVTRSAGV